MSESQEPRAQGAQTEETRCIEFMGKIVPVEQTIQHMAPKGLLHILLHDRRKIYNKILQYFALHYLTPPRLRVRFQAWRGVRFKDPKSVFIGDGVNFDERLPEGVVLGRGVWIAAGCRIIAHRFLSYRFVEKAEVVFEDYVRVGVNAIIMGPVRISEGAAIAPGALVTKDVPPYTVFGGERSKAIGPVPKKLVDYELLVKNDFETGTVMQRLPPAAGSGRGGGEAKGS
jgi:acetyltransferase-like isoleucine patch superfamily enzyme